MTNADRIRQMTDEELADAIGFNECKDTAHGYECPAWIQSNCGGKCKKAFSGMAQTGGERRCG